MNAKGKEQCQICERWFYPWELTGKEDGIWFVVCCEACARKGRVYEVLPSASPKRKKQEQLKLF